MFDLHNCFDFDWLAIHGNGDIRLAFIPNVTHGGGYLPIVIHAKSVKRFGLSHNFGPATVTDLDEIGYKSSDDNDDNWLLSQSQATDKDDMFFRFNDGHYVRFHSEHAWLIENSEFRCNGVP